MKNLRTVLLLVLSLFLPISAISAPTTIHLLAASGQLTNVQVRTDMPGSSVHGYVGDFSAADSKLTLTVPTKRGGLYDIRVRYTAPNGQKSCDLSVNGRASSVLLPATPHSFAEQAAGTVELRTGKNVIEVGRGWGYFGIDSIDLVPFHLAAQPKPADIRPADRGASPAVRAFLRKLANNYGSKTLTGQYESKDCDYVHGLTGQIPLILGADLMDYSPSRVARGTAPKDYIERVIARAHAGQIITLSWHWNAPKDLLDTQDHPWYKGFYTDATTFDLQRALKDPQSEDYRLLIRDMDTIAIQLRKLQDAGVVVLWRPLHEADGGWFWWGARGPEPFKQLWRIMFDRFTRVDHLHNLIWVDSSGLKPEWYPGDPYVDIVAIDEYPKDPLDRLSADWKTLVKQHGSRKLIALSEFGGVPDINGMSRLGVRWSYFVSWTGTEQKTPTELVRSTYLGSRAVNVENKSKLK